MATFPSQIPHHNAFNALRIDATSDLSSQKNWTRASTLKGNSTFVNEKASPQSLETQPWGYEGYPLFSRWMASDDDFLVLKKFDAESVRVALWMQDRVAESSAQLDGLDNYYKDQGADCGKFRISEYPDERLKVLDKLAKHLKEYHDFVNSFSSIKEKARASRLQVKNVRTWLQMNHRAAIDPEETKFVTEEENQRDLISLAKKGSPLRRFINHYCLFITEMPCLKERRSTKTTTYSKESTIDRIVYCITIILGIGMLLGPLWLLQIDTTPGGTQSTLLAIVSGFTFAFAGFFAIVAVAQPFEVLAATAAYAAVLMVYLQIQAGMKSSG